MVNASLELLSHAKALQYNTLAEYSDQDGIVADKDALEEKARGTKRRRSEVSNSKDGVSLRLKVKGHTPVHGLKGCFVLRGQKK